jgi:hypothetical protein
MEQQKITDGYLRGRSENRSARIGDEAERWAEAIEFAGTNLD